MNNTFDINRFTLLLKRELWSGNKKPIIVAGAVFGFMILFALFQIYVVGEYRVLNWNMFPFIILLGGFVFTSVIFNEFNDKVGTHHYLSLPASAFEKFLSKWFISAILFPIATCLLFWIYAKIGDTIFFNVAQAGEVKYYEPWKLTGWWSLFFLKLYFVFQSFYLIGAIIFQRYTFFKTTLGLWIIQVSIGLLFLLFFRIFFNEFFESLFQTRTDIMWTTNDEVNNFMTHTFQPILEYVFWLLLAPIIWTAGYFKLKEKEA